MDAYDDDDDDAADEDGEGDDGHYDGTSIGRFLGSAARDVIAPEDDPYLDEDEDDEDAEEHVIRDSDSCILVGTTTDENSVVEVYVYDEKSSNLYVHHEISIPSIPLALAWLPTHPRAGQTSALGTPFPATGSFAAVGTFLPGIEIWNCDVISPVEPVCVLGGFEEQDPLLAPPASAPSKGKKKGKKGKKAQPTLKPGSHTDAVLSLAFHSAAPTRLASGSADTTIKLWDISTQQCTATLSGHKDKVQSIEFNPAEFNVLLSGAYDQTVRVQDVRAAAGAASARVSADIESVRWDPHSATGFFAATEDGVVAYYDARAMDKAVWTLKAHKKATSCLAPNAIVPGVFATGSTDGTVKVWEAVAGATTPTLLGSRNLGAGKLMCMSFDRSSPFVLAAGGDEGTLAVWDTLENVGVNERYGRVAEEMGLGPQTLPEDYIKMQREGGQSKGVGPGKEGTGRNSQGGDAGGDDDSDDEEDERMQMYGMGAEDDEDEGEDGAGDDDEDDDDDEE